MHEAMTVRGLDRPAARRAAALAFRDIADHLETIDRYTTYAARQMHEDRPPRRLSCRSPATRRSRSCATISLRGGFRDGAAGLIISAMNSYYVFLKFAKLWELRPEHHPQPRTPNR